MKVTPLIMAGGCGSRLWPVSTPEYPKQFLPLKMGGSPFDNALQRVSDREIFEPPIIICADQHQNLIKDLTKGMGIDIICEPVGRNTAPACCVGAMAANALRGDDSTLLILPADHFIPDLNGFEQAVLNAVPLVHSGHMMCFGIRPEFGHTEFGYIQLGSDIKPHSYRVKSFTEKPNLELANRYLKSGQYLWNTGIYCIKSNMLLDEMKKFQPDIVLSSIQSWENAKLSQGAYILDESSFSICPKISIDYAVMEHTDKTSVQIVDFEWRDLGGWDALMEFAV